MLYHVTEIKFDFETDEGFPEKEYQDKLIDEVMNTLWEAEDEDELVDLISDETGWCILSLDAVEVEEAQT